MNIIAMLDRTHKYSKELGKKGSETDILMTHKHIDDGWITFLDPIRYPDKIKGLCKSLNVCNKIFLNVQD